MKRVLCAVILSTIALSSAACGSLSFSSGPAVTVPAHPTYSEVVNACQDIIAMNSGANTQQVVEEYNRCLDSADRLLLRGR